MASPIAQPAEASIAHPASHPASHPAHCQRCQQPLAFAFTMAFQPIVDVQSRSVFAAEALVRGIDGAGAGQILGQVTADNRYRFDQACRVRAVELAARMRMPCPVSINFLPNAIYEPAACLETTITAAQRAGLPLSQILFEVTENEQSADISRLRMILAEYRRQGFRSAIDDFGAGYNGLNLLAEFQPDFVKLDMLLVRHLDQDAVRCKIVDGIAKLCRTLGVEVIAEGVETPAESHTLQELGIVLQQGYLFARPALETLPAVNWQSA